MFTAENMLTSTPEQLVALNDELAARLMSIDPNDYGARQEVEAAFRLEVAGRPEPDKPMPVSGMPVEHAPDTEQTDHTGQTDQAGHTVTETEQQPAVEEVPLSRAEQRAQDRQERAEAKANE